MAALGPFEPRPRLAAAVSGGADSLCLALLADRWARDCGGDVLALIVDHGLRAASAAEAAATRARLAARGIDSRVLTLTGLTHGPALAERARQARYAALAASAWREGRVHLLLGHHLADQAETVAMRMLAGSDAAGLAAMPALAETAALRLLRPLLAIPPARLRAALRAAGMDWVEDPSNADPAAQRARLRALRRDQDGEGPATRAMAEAAVLRGLARARAERRLAAGLAARVSLHPEGYARLTPGPLPPEALARVLASVAGRRFPPPLDQVAPLAAAPRAATLGGARLLPAGRLGEGWLAIREAAAMQPRVPAADGAEWDGRFRLRLAGQDSAGLSFGALGPAAAGLRAKLRRPAALLATLPAIWRGDDLMAVPHLGYATHADMAAMAAEFVPSWPLSAGPFQPSRVLGMTDDGECGIVPAE